MLLLVEALERRFRLAVVLAVPIPAGFSGVGVGVGVGVGAGAGVLGAVVVTVFKYALDTQPVLPL